MPVSNLTPSNDDVRNGRFETLMNFCIAWHLKLVDVHPPQPKTGLQFILILCTYIKIFFLNLVTFDLFLKISWLFLKISWPYRVTKHKVSGIAPVCAPKMHTSFTSDGSQTQNFATIYIFPQSVFVCTYWGAPHGIGGYIVF